MSHRCGAALILQSGGSDVPGRPPNSGTLDHEKVDPGILEMAFLPNEANKLFVMNKTDSAVSPADSVLCAQKVVLGDERQIHDLSRSSEIGSAGSRCGNG